SASSASSGASLNAQSTAVAAAQEGGGPNTNVSTINNESSTKETQTSNIPSPIANRGSLDKDTTFSPAGSTGGG
ncbi:hypothetical protein EBT25_11350, partial [bacterium]|nr:hypothetical protein [bacterium]